MKTPWRKYRARHHARHCRDGPDGHVGLGAAAGRPLWRAPVPDLTRTEFVAALQVATAAAERRVVAEALKCPRTEAWLRSASISVSPVKHLG